MKADRSSPETLSGAYRRWFSVSRRVGLQPLVRVFWGG